MVRARPVPSALAEARHSAAAALLGRSPAIVSIREEIEVIARNDVRVVLVSGESGTGKDLVARAIHAAGPRSAGQFVALNCSAVPDSLLEAEFFGYEAGAFTDARKRKSGLLEVAHGGTLFLDEIAEMGLGLQAKLLRLLEDQSFRRLGGTESVAVDVQFVAATNQDLATAIEERSFRRDLFYRLSAISIDIAPLRTRPEDVPDLAQHFLEHYSKVFHKSLERFDEAALDRLRAHPWPGNVRELRNVVERAALLHQGPVLGVDSLLLGPGGSPPSSVRRQQAPEDLDLEKLELGALVRALEQCGGNQSRAAELLNVSRDAVRSRMKKFGIRIETRVIVERPPTPRA